MWIVRLALRRTYTFVVLAVLIAVLGLVSIYRMPTDVFPEIDVPIVSVVFVAFRTATTPTLALVGAVPVAVRMQRQGGLNASRRREAFAGAE